MAMNEELMQKERDWYAQLESHDAQQKSLLAVCLSDIMKEQVVEVCFTEAGQAFLMQRYAKQSVSQQNQADSLNHSSVGDIDHVAVRSTDRATCDLSTNAAHASR